MIVLFLLAIIYTIVWWSYFGYPLILKEKNNIGNQDIKPKRFSVLVPVFNERMNVGKKINNLKDIDYPKNKLDIIFVDGGSDDGTIEKIKSSGFKLIKAKGGDKIRDINSVLPYLKTEYIMITDCDSILGRKNLKRFNKILNNKNVGAVGAFTTPMKGINIDREFWKRSNFIRVKESEFFSASSLVASCYAFKSDCLTKFPDDVIADDLFLTYKIASKGKRVIYDSGSIATESRNPSTLSNFFKHKQRKSHADIKEIFRFAFKSKQSRDWRIIFWTKFFQIALIPLLIPIFVFLSFVLMFQNPILWIIGFLIAVTSIKLIPSNNESDMVNDIKLFLIVNTILLFSLFTYHIFEKTSRYQKTS